MPGTTDYPHSADKYFDWIIIPMIINARTVIIAQRILAKLIIIIFNN